MHLWDGPRGFLGSVPIVAGTVPLAVGAGFAAKLQGSDAVAVSYLGDGAVEEGAVQESLNLATMLGARVVFVVENNLFSSHMHISLRQPARSTARFAEVHGMPGVTVDGNDIVAVYKAASDLIGRARAGHGPGLLEAVTYRWYGHVDWREDLDVGVSRSQADVAMWKARDPLMRLRTALEGRGLWSAERHEQAVSEIRNEIEAAWADAMADPWPDRATLHDHVYEGGRA